MQQAEHVTYLLLFCCPGSDYPYGRQCDKEVKLGVQLSSGSPAMFHLLMDRSLITGKGATKWGNCWSGSFCKQMRQ